MPLSELKAMLAAEKADALAAVSASRLSTERADAMDYYLGEMSRDLPAAEGRSQAVSTDVADTIEGLMPALMEIFCAGDEVVRFEPVGPQDVAAAEQETDYVNHVFMQVNPGFLVLYSFIKDALLSKVGVVKVWWEERTLEERETYYDLGDDAFALLAADPDVEVIAHSERPLPVPPAAMVAAVTALPPAALPAQPGVPTPPGAPPAPPLAPAAAAPLAPPAAAPLGSPAALPLAAPPLDADELLDGPKLHDVEVRRTRNAANARIEPVPPEEFGIARNARSLREADYCFHKVLLTEGKLIAQGFDAAQVRALPSYTGISNTEETARDTVDEFQLAGDSLNAAARRIEVIEHYVRMDYEGDGRALLYKVTTAGEEGEILRRDGNPDIAPFDTMPFAAMTPVIVTHRFFGRSIADLVMDIQRIKTALLRAMLDNAYLANNPRVEVAEQFTSAETLDDLLVSRPGGIVRTKQPGGLTWQQVPTIGGHVFPALEYMDSTRELRTGVTRQGQGIGADALQNQSATAVNQVFSAAQARIRLIARIFAETGIRDMFTLVHATIRKHGQQAQTVRLRNQWITVDPREWKTRYDMTVNVGLGTGTRSERLAHVMAVIELQKQALAGGLTNLVNAQNLYASAREVTKLVGLVNVDAYFTDPKSVPPPLPPPGQAGAPAPPDHKLIETQARLAFEERQAQAEMAAQNNKAQSELALQQARFEFDKQLALLEHELKAKDQQFRHMQTAFAAAPSAGGGGGVPPSADLGALPPADAGGAPVDPNSAPAPLVNPNAALIAELVASLRQMNAPKRVVRDAHGRVSHLEPMPPVSS
jgi:hypothetical protein